MIHYQSSKTHLHYFDFLLNRYLTVPADFLFLLGYARAFGDSVTSDTLNIPGKLWINDGLVPVRTPDLHSRIHVYLSSLAQTELTSDGFSFHIYALGMFLDSLGFTFDKFCVVPNILSKSESAKATPQEILDYRNLDLQGLLALGFFSGCVQLGYPTNILELPDVSWYKGTYQNLAQSSFDVMSSIPYESRPVCQFSSAWIGHSE